MKNLLLFAAIFAVVSMNAQVGIGTSSPHTSSQLELNSTSKGLLVPRMTATQKDNITSPATGLLVYQTDGTAGFYYYSGGVWTWLSHTLMSKTEGVDFDGSLLVGHTTTGSLSSASNNTGVGVGAMQGISLGTDNTAVGYRALYANGNYASYNTAIGSQALRNNLGDPGGAGLGEHNIGVGYQAVYSNTGGNYNIGIGSNVLYANGTGNNNIAIGHSALTTGTAFDGNVAVGHEALRLTVTNDNTAIGRSALTATTIGNNNTAIGAWAADNNTIGSNNIVIGYGARASTATVSNQVTIGNSSNNSYRMYAASWTNASDEKLKHGIKDIPVGIDFIKQLHPVEFIYNNADKEEKSLGFVAQEVKQAVENSGLQNSGLVTPLDNEYLGLRTTELIPVLVKAVQEQQKEIEQLKKLVGTKKLKKLKKTESGK